MVRVIAKVRVEDKAEAEAAVREVQALALELGARDAKPIPGVPMIVIELPAGQVEKLRASPRVERVQIDKPDRPY